MRPLEVDHIHQSIFWETEDELQSFCLHQMAKHVDILKNTHKPCFLTCLTFSEVSDSTKKLKKLSTLLRTFYFNPFFFFFPFHCMPGVQRKISLGLSRYSVRKSDLSEKI